MFVAGEAFAGDAQVKAVRLGTHQEFTRLVLETSAPVGYRIFTLSGPERVVIDLPGVVWRVGDMPDFMGSRLVANLRHGQPKPGMLRVVADVRGAIRTPRAFTIPAQGAEPFRLVVDLAAAEGLAALPDVAGVDLAEPSEKPGAFPAPVPKPEAPGSRKYVVVVDPGHGGVDPGAISRKGTEEKVITLAYAKELVRALNGTGRFRAELTRSDDRYLRLRERIEIARQKKAALFISVHADSAPDRMARGLSVYTLSEAASDKEAELLARRENKVDILSGMDLSNESADVANILIDLAQRETKNKSSLLAEHIIGELASRVHLTRNTHRYAGFAVLKAPDIPSVLVELGFLSNRDDEKLLRSDHYRDKLVQSIVRGVERYFDEAEGVR